MCESRHPYMIYTYDGPPICYTHTHIYTYIYYIDVKNKNNSWLKQSERLTQKK